MKNKKLLLLAWGLIVVTLVVTQYFVLTNNKETKVVYGKVIEDRNLTLLENEYFTTFFSENSGFINTYYENSKDLKLETLLLNGQGLDKRLLLNDAEYQKIMESDLKDIENYEVYYNRPTELFTYALSGENLRNMYREKTLKNYSKNVDGELFKYNKTLDVYYTTSVFDVTTPSYTYAFSNIKITNNNIYQISYTAYDEDDKEVLSGLLSLKKDSGLYFLSNIMKSNELFKNEIDKIKNEYGTEEFDTKKIYIDKEEKEVKIYKSKLFDEGFIYEIDEEKYYFNGENLILVYDEYYYTFNGKELKYNSDLFEYNLEKNKKEFNNTKETALKIKELIEQ